MRVAAVALVLIVGAAVVLAFANTLNTWVLGGLLGGLAAILLSIPISLTLFTLLARRHDARQRFAVSALEDEPHFADERNASAVVYEAEGYVLLEEADDEQRERARPSPDKRRTPRSGYLALPPAGYDFDAHDDDPGLSLSGEPRNYPRQPRHAAHPMERSDEVASAPPVRSHRHPSTRSLAQHQSAARYQARQEAQQQRPSRRSDSGLSNRRDQARSLPSVERTRSAFVRPPVSTPRPVRSADAAYLPKQQNMRAPWNDDDEFTDDFTTEQWRDRSRLRASRQRNPHTTRDLHASDPQTDSLVEQSDEHGSHMRRMRQDPERVSGSLRSPLVRRAPYLYEDDPLRAEFAQQLENERPITRRSSLYEHYEDEED